MGLRPPYAADPTSNRSQSTVGGPNVRDPRLARLEAILFLAGEPISTRKISLAANLADGTEARTLIRRLNELYDRDGSAFRAEEVAGGFQLLTRRKFAGWLRRLLRTHVEPRLSTAALETLAVVAYRQPATRADVEAIRGVQCDEMLRQLMDRDLVKIIGRSSELGRPFLFGTTRRFLQFFGLRHLDELPRAELLRAEALRAGSSAAEAQDPASESTIDADHPDMSPISSSIEESDVKIAAESKLAREEELNRRRSALVAPLRAEDEDDDFEEEEDEEDDDEEDDEEEDDEEEEDFDDDDFDDDWEEVDDEDEEEDEEDEDWDDDEEEDEDWDDDDEEEEEEEDDEE